jgi:hypothetical protein
MANPNLEMLKRAVAHLGDLANELVFVGGCTTGLFLTDEALADVRPTKDVDAIVEALTYAKYVEFGERLQQLKFHHDTSEGAPICRWVKEETILDVMPTEGEFLGFKGRWYADALMSAQSREISPQMLIKVVTPPYFFATKLEAFSDRGNGDFLESRDLEDIITVVDGREELTAEIQEAPDNVREYIVRFIDGLLHNKGFIDALPGHLNPDIERVDIVLKRLKDISVL